MTMAYGEISWRGRTLRVPAQHVDGALVVISGRAVRTATVRDEEWLDELPIRHAASFVDRLRASGLRADVLSFGTGPAPLESAVSVPGAVVEADNVAVINTSDFKAWWDGLPQEARKNTRRAAKRGVVVTEAVFDDRLVRGIKGIYDEAPIRQGRRFWHHGKDLATVQRENGTYLDRSTFLVARLGDEIIGFIKWVRVGNVARIMQILCLNAHQEKRPIIALIAKAAEVCHAQGLHYLVYGKYTYGKKGDSSITEFKRRLGFTQLDYARHHVPLNAWGRVALALGLHRGFVGLIPAPLLQRLLQWRSAWYVRKTRNAGAAAAASADD
ncbi:hypothetical protein [Rhizobacter fulvus]